MEEESKELTIEKGLELGKIFAESGLFPDIKSAAQGYVKILAGRELGMSPMQSINAFYFVGGRLGIAAQAVSAMVKSSGKYDYKIEKHDETECTIIFYCINGQREEIGKSTFTIKDAAKAGIVNKEGWKNYPRNLLFARALMNGVRWYCPDAIHSSLYSVEELYDIDTKKSKSITIDAEGNIDDKEIEETI